jgi:hypothetical protein
MATLLEENKELQSQLANVQGQLQEILAKREADANELKKKSFREATLDGELQALRAQASESMILRLRVTELEHKLREADAKEQQQVGFQLKMFTYGFLAKLLMLLQGLSCCNRSLDNHILICCGE